MAQPTSDHLVELYSLVGDEDDLIPVGPTETQNIRVLRLQRETTNNTNSLFTH